MADDAPADEAPVTFNIKSSSDAKYTLTIPLTTTVLELKQKLSTTEYADIPPDRQRLIYSGRVLKDPDTLGSYKIKEGHTVHLVKGAASNARQNPATQGSSSTTGTTAAPSVPSNLASGTGNNPLAGLTGARYAGFAQLPNQNMFGPDGGMGPPPDPEQVITMLQNPQFASTVNEALQNPQLIDMMIQQNPMLRQMGPEVRQMMQSPEFRRMMTDPEALRNMSRMQQMMGGGGIPGMGGGGGNPAFPAPGVTDTTPGQEGNRNAQTGNTQSPPYNPLAMFENPAAAAANPFAMLFPQASNTPATSPPPAASAGQGTPQPSTPSAENQTNPTPQQRQQATLPGFYANPALMQQMMAAMTGAQTPAGSTNPSANTATNPPNPEPNNPFASLFAGVQYPYGLPGMMGGYGTPPPAAPVDNRPPEERYAEQLRQLNDMGFYEFERNIEALRRTGGSVQGAVEYLLSHP